MVEIQRPVKATTGIQINSLYRRARGQIHTRQIHGIGIVYSTVSVRSNISNERAWPIGRVSRSGKHRKPNLRDSRQRYRGFEIIGVNAIFSQSRTYKSRTCRPPDRKNGNTHSVTALSLDHSFFFFHWFSFIRISHVPGFLLFLNNVSFSLFLKHVSRMFYKIGTFFSLFLMYFLTIPKRVNGKENAKNLFFIEENIFNNICNEKKKIRNIKFSLDI